MIRVHTMPFDASEKGGQRRRPRPPRRAATAHLSGRCPVRFASGAPVLLELLPTVEVVGGRWAGWPGFVLVPQRRRARSETS